VLHQWSILWQMEFNSSKCEFLRITNPVIYQYSINDTVMQQVAHAKYLGVIIDEKLLWNEHILKVTNKVRQTTAFLRRNFSNCPAHLKCNIQDHGASNTRICLYHLGPPYQLKYYFTIESIQRSAARFCFNNYSNFSSVSGMLNRLSLPTLQERRKINKLIMMFKIINNLIGISTSKFIPKQRSLRGVYYTQLCTKIDSYKFSFFLFVIKLWNSLPYL